MHRHTSPPPIARVATAAGSVLVVLLLGGCSAQPPAVTASESLPATAAEPVPLAATPAGGTAPDEPVRQPWVSDDSGRPCPPDPHCGSECSNQPFVPTSCWTTDYGPAKADIFLEESNFLYCSGGSYALCFFSGPPYPTGKPRDRKDNPVLSCSLEGDGLANCTCEVYTTGAYFVDINAILNRGAWYQTVAACGPTGAGCKNLAVCGRDGTGTKKDGSSDCDDLPVAPVCGYVQNQDPQDPSVSLIPGADLVSAFSFAMHDHYRTGSTDCAKGEYAGCMTAPCYFQEGATVPPNDGDPIQCLCPTYTGDFQIGQFGRERECKIGLGNVYVWSAAYKVPPDKQKGYQ